MKNSANYEVAKFENEEGFTNGWYVLQVNIDDRHVIWQSEVFATEEEAKIVYDKLVLSKMKKGYEEV